MYLRKGKNDLISLVEERKKKFMHSFSRRILSSEDSFESTSNTRKHVKKLFASDLQNKCCVDFDYCFFFKTVNFLVFFATAAAS